MVMCDVFLQDARSVFWKMLPKLRGEPTLPIFSCGRLGSKLPKETEGIGYQEWSLPEKWGLQSVHAMIFVAFILIAMLRNSEWIGVDFFSQGWDLDFLHHPNRISNQIGKKLIKKTQTYKTWTWNRFIHSFIHFLLDLEHIWKTCI